MVELNEEKEKENNVRLSFPNRKDFFSAFEINDNSAQVASIKIQVKEQTARHTNRQTGRQSDRQTDTVMQTDR